MPKHQTLAELRALRRIARARGLDNVSRALYWLIAHVHADFCSKGVAFAAQELEMR